MFDRQHLLQCAIGELHVNENFDKLVAFRAAFGPAFNVEQAEPELKVPVQ